MIQFPNQTVYNLLRSANPFYNSRHAALVSCNSDLSTLLSTLQTKWTGYSTADKYYLATGIVDGSGSSPILIPDLIMADLGGFAMPMADPPLPANPFTFIHDTSFNNATQALAYAFIQTDYVSGAISSLPAIGGIMTIAEAVPSINGTGFPSYSRPACITFLSIISALTAILPKMGTPVVDYSPTNPTASLAYQTLGCVFGSIDTLVTNLDTAINALNTRFNLAAYSPHADAHTPSLPTLVSNLQAAAAALTTRLQSEIGTFNTYLSKLKAYGDATQTLLHFENPVLRPIIQSIATNPTLNPDLYSALLTLIKNGS